MPTLIHTIQRPVVEHYAITFDRDDDGAVRRVVVDIRFSDESISLVNPYDLETCHEIVTGDPSPIDVLDIHDDQWEDKKYKLEFHGSGGAFNEIWAEMIDR